MKHTKDFTIEVPKNRFNTKTGRYDLLGRFFIDGKAYCQHPSDAESFDYDIERIQFQEAGTDEREDCTKPIMALIASDVVDFEPPIMAHLEYLWGKEDLDRTTDLNQDDYFVTTDREAA